MIEKIINQNYNIIEYIGMDYYKCLYLYLDYKQYGIINDNINIYIQKQNNNIIGLLLNYSTSLHLFSKDLNCNYKEIADFIKEKKYKAIFGEKEIISNIEELLHCEYYSEYGNVWEINEINGIDTSEVEIAKENDFKEIARLIMTDKDMASSYEYNDLVRQLKERYLQKFGRNYVIRDNSKIVSHISTNAEIDNVAIVALIIVDSNYRRRGLATKMLKKMSEDLIKEGKKAYLINYSVNSTLLYTKLGLRKCCEWGKLYNN